MTIAARVGAGLSVIVDDRLRLLTSALLLTGLPAREQRRFAHKVHPLAEVTSAALDHLRTHRCVRMMGAVADEQPFLLIVPHVPL